MAKVQLSKSIKAKRLDTTGLPLSLTEYAVPAGAIVDDLFEENGNYHFVWLGHTYGLAAGQLGRAYKEVDD